MRILFFEWMQYMSFLSSWRRADVIVIAWLLDIKLPVQSVPIITKVVSMNINPAHDEVYSIQHYVIKSVNDFRQVMVYSRYWGFFPNKTNRYNIL